MLTTSWHVKQPLRKATSGNEPTTTDFIVGGFLIVDLLYITMVMGMIPLPIKVAYLLDKDVQTNYITTMETMLFPLRSGDQPWTRH